MSLAVVLQPQGACGCLLTRLADGVADLLLLPDDDGGIDVLQHEGQLLCRLAPVDGTEHAARLGRGQQTFEDAVAVLTQPQDAVAGTETGAGQGVGQPVDAVVHLRVGEAGVLADQRGVKGIAAPVLAQHVAQGQRVEQVHGRA